MTRALAIALVLVGCAIKPPPAEPSEAPETWTKPSVQPDCERRCATAPDSDHARCIDLCEGPPRAFCGTSRLESNQIPRGVAITIGVVGIVATSLLAAGYITPQP